MAEDSQVEVVGIQDIDPVVKVQDPSRVHRPSRIGGIRQVTLCDRVSGKSCENVFVELFYVH